MLKKHGTLVKMWVDMGYQGKDLKEEIKEEYRIEIELEIVKSPHSTLQML